jgi:plastocyanin
LDKDLFYISLALLLIGLGGQLSWYFFGHVPCVSASQGGNPYLFGAPCDPNATTASFQEMQNISGYMTIFGFILLPAGLFKDGLPSPGFTAKIAIGFILILLVGVGFTGIILTPSASKSSLKPDGFISISMGSSNPQPDSNVTFSPRNVTVIIGLNNTVEWKNNDVAAHTVTSMGNDPTSFNSNVIPVNGTFIYEFTQPGYYLYHCTLHAWMFGSVMVEVSNSTSTNSTTSSSATK